MQAAANDFTNTFSARRNWQACYKFKMNICRGCNKSFVIALRVGAYCKYEWLGPSISGRPESCIHSKWEDRRPLRIKIVDFDRTASIRRTREENMVESVKAFTNSLFCDGSHPRLDLVEHVGKTVKSACQIGLRRELSRPQPHGDAETICETHRNITAAEVVSEHINTLFGNWVVRHSISHDLVFEKGLPPRCRWIRPRIPDRTAISRLNGGQVAVEKLSRRLSWNKRLQP